MVFKNFKKKPFFKRNQYKRKFMRKTPIYKKPYKVGNPQIQTVVCKQVKAYNYYYLLNRQVLSLPKIGAYAQALFTDASDMNDDTDITNNYYKPRSRAAGVLGRYDNAYVFKQTIVVTIPDSAPFQLYFVRLDKQWSKVNAGTPTIQTIQQSTLKTQLTDRIDPNIITLRRGKNYFTKTFRYDQDQVFRMPSNDNWSDLGRGVPHQFDRDLGVFYTDPSLRAKGALDLATFRDNILKTIFVTFEFVNTYRVRGRNVGTS